MDDCLKELKACDDRAKKAIADGTHLSDELRHEQERSLRLEAARKTSEMTLKVQRSNLSFSEEAQHKLKPPWFCIWYFSIYKPKGFNLTKHILEDYWSDNYWSFLNTSPRLNISPQDFYSDFLPLL